MWFVKERSRDQKVEISLTLLTWRIQKTFFFQEMENCKQKNSAQKGFLMSRQMELAAIKSIILQKAPCLLFVTRSLHFCSARVNGICKSCLIPLLEEGCLFAFMFVSINWLARNLLVSTTSKTIENCNYISLLAHSLCPEECNKRMETPPFSSFGTESCVLGCWQDVCDTHPTNHQMGPRIKIPISRLRAKSCMVIAACCLQSNLIRN